VGSGADSVGITCTGACVGGGGCVGAGAPPPRAEQAKPTSSINAVNKNRGFKGFIQSPFALFAAQYSM